MKRECRKWIILKFLTIQMMKTWHGTHGGLTTSTLDPTVHVICFGWLYLCIFIIWMVKTAKISVFSIFFFIFHHFLQCFRGASAAVIFTLFFCIALDVWVIDSHFFGWRLPLDPIFRWEHDKTIYNAWNSAERGEPGPWRWTTINYLPTLIYKKWIFAIP